MCAGISGVFWLQRLPVAVRLGEHDRDGLAVVGSGDRLDLVVARGAGRQVCLAADVLELRVAALRLPVVDEVVGVDRHAVGPDRLRVYLVNDRLRVLVRHRGAGHELGVQRRVEVRLYLVDPGQRLVEDLGEDELVVPLEQRVEPGQILVEGKGERAAALHGARARAFRRRSGA
jgi:hypothetical protein